MKKLGVLLCFAATGCGGSGSRATDAALTTGLAVAAAAINRAATNDCWASCTHGTVCDRERGLCVTPDEIPPPTQPPPLAETECWEEDGATVCSDEELVPVEVSPRAADPCRGRCERGEVCVLAEGAATCVLVP